MTVVDRSIENVDSRSQTSLDGGHVGLIGGIAGVAGYVPSVDESQSWLTLAHAPPGKVLARADLRSVAVTGGAAALACQKAWGNSLAVASECIRAFAMWSCYHDYGHMEWLKESRGR
jgi:hypothetical protein